MISVFMDEIRAATVDPACNTYDLPSSAEFVIHTGISAFQSVVLKGATGNTRSVVALRPGTQKARILSALTQVPVALPSASTDYNVGMSAYQDQPPSGFQR